MTQDECVHCGVGIFQTFGQEWVHRSSGEPECFPPGTTVAEPASVERARARRSDPPTSHEAAASVSGLRESQAAVLSVFPTTPLIGMTDQELIAKYERMTAEGHVPLQSESGIRTRRSELVKKGKLVDSGDRRLTTNGRKSTVWRREGT